MRKEETHIFCDRCGAEIKEMPHWFSFFGSYRFTKAEIEQQNLPVVDYVENFYKIPFDVKEYGSSLATSSGTCSTKRVSYDLCPACTKELNNWLQNKE